MSNWRSRLVERDAGYVTPCLEWTGATTRGYGVVSVDGRLVYVHRLAWMQAFGDPGALHVLHKCDNPPCARLDHLFTGTNRDNIDDMIAKGRSSKNRGEKSHTAKLTEREVLAIRAANGSLRALGRQYGVSNVAIHNIRTRKTWRHVKP